MIKSRSYIRNLLNTVQNIKERYVYFEKDIVLLSNQAERDRTIEHYDYVIKALKEELQTLPIGYRYTGTYYLKKPYTIPPEFEKCEGSLYMQENLVSWQIEKTPGVLKDYSYYRSIFKEPYGKVLTKEDAEPVLSQKFSSA